MVLQDLLTTSPGEIQADVLVIGAGIAGLILAARLSEKGRKVVVLESGGRHQDEETHPLNEVVLRGQAYQGAVHGRFRCLGGTSTRWGGAMLPFLPEDLSASRSGTNLSWGSANYTALMRYLPEIESLFGLPPDDYRALDAPAISDFAPRFAKWPPFKSRNVATLLKDTLEAADGPIVWLNATAAGFELDASGSLVKVTAQAPNGRQLSAAAKTTALAAGAIESTRLLLLLDANYDRRIFAPDDVLGRNFYDHLSAATADIIPNDAAAFHRLFGFRFQGRVMRSLRYELNGDARLSNDLPGAFFHIAVVADEGSGFAALRDVFRKVQRHTLPNAEEIARLVADSGWLARAIWWRFAKGRLLAPANAKFELHQVIEQVPDTNNRISLSAERSDNYGVPLAVIDWRVHTADLQNFDQVSNLFMQNWRASPLSRIAAAVERPKSETSVELTSGGGTYHPGGSARIGVSPRDGVVDGDLKVFRIPNLRVVSTAAFPNGGTASPTQMLMLFAARAADQMHAELDGPGK